MKQFLLLLTMLAVGCPAALLHPFWGLLLYYTFAVLRPQTIWDWALPYDVPWSRLAALAVLAGLLLNVSRVWREARFGTINAILVLFGVALFPSMLTAHDPGTAQFWGVEYAKVLLIALIAGLVIDRFWQVRTLAAMVLICLGYIGWEANSRYLFDGRLDIFHYGYGALDNNGAGLMLAMGIPFAYAFAVTASRHWLRIGAALIGVIMLHAMLMSYSRGAMLATVLAVVWLLWRHRPRIHAAAIVVLICLIVPVLAGPEIRERFFSTTNFSADYSAQSRFSSWDAAAEIIREHPLTGIGIRNSNSYTHNYGADQVGRTIHSQYLQIAADSGLPACLLYIALMACAVLLMGRARQQVLRRIAAGGDLARDAQRRLYQMEKIILGCQASLLVFAFGGLFLSLEVFELPWLLIALAGLLPRVVESELRRLDAETADADAPVTRTLSRTRRGRRRRRRRRELAPI